MKEVVPQIYRLGVFRGSGVLGANVYLLADDTLTVIDTGYKGRTGEIIRAAAKLGYTPERISRIIITHHHADHTGSLTQLKSLTGASVIAHREDVPYIEGRLPQPGPGLTGWLATPVSLFRPLWSAAPVHVDMPVRNGDVLPVLGGLRVLHTPGHTPGSICLYLAAKKLVFTGDLLGNTFGVRLPSAMYSADMSQIVRSIRLLADQDFEILCFGHGPPLLRKARHAVNEFLSRLKTNKKAGRE